MRRLSLVAATLIAVALTVNAQQPGGRAVHVTLHEGTSMAAALSPDGRTIAIDLLGTLWTIPAGGGVATPVTDISMDARQPSWSPDARIQKLYPPAVWQRWREQTRTPASAVSLDDAARLVTPQERTLYQVVTGGGRVTAGTDAPINPYGLALLMELENYASSGLTPVDVLRTATSVSAEALGAGADLGSIEPGTLADLVVIDGNPLMNIKDLRRVTRVMKNGQVFEADALRRR